MGSPGGAVTALSYPLAAPGRTGGASRAGANMRPGMTNRALLVGALALGAVAWLFGGPLFGGRVLYYRDIGVTYYPDLVFVSRELSRGVWPLWHPGADGGAPFLMAYPVHLVMLALAGARATLAVSPPLHVLLAIVGQAALARRLGASFAGAAVSGGVFGLSGLMLGSVLYPVFLAAAWAPLGVERFLALVEAPSSRRAAALGLVLAVQASTLGAEAAVATAIAAAVLVPRRPGRRALVATAGAVLLAGALASPALFGAAAMLAGTARGHGFAPEVALSYSTPAPVLLEAVLPRFLGDPHTFSEVGFWGQPFYPGGSPFFLSLYLGPVVLLLAACAGWRGRARLWALAVLGVLISLGAHGPLAPVLAPLMGPLRGPVKLFLLTTLALSLLAGLGVTRAGEARRRRLTVAPGVVLLALSLAAAAAPTAVSAALSSLVPAAGGPLARHVIAVRWPPELAVTGLVALAAGLALTRGGRLAAVAGLLAVLDLVRVNGELNPSADAAFYDLRPAVARAVDAARREGTFRWFSYGVAHSPPLHWSPAVAARNSDVWLFYLDRQALMPRTQVLDGLDGAFDIDRMGLAPEGATLAVAEASPALFRKHHDRLRRANVRWVLSFHALPEDLVSLRDEVRFDEVAETLRLYELRDALPRAFFVARLDGPLRPGPGSVGYEPVDAHTVVLRASTPPGFVLILDGHHPDWTAVDASGPLPVLRAAGRYRAVPTPGGERQITLRYRPRWRAPALALAAFGAFVAIGLALWPPRRASG
jgi:hypothetical protein